MIAVLFYSTYAVLPSRQLVKSPLRRERGVYSRREEVRNGIYPIQCRAVGIGDGGYSPHFSVQSLALKIEIRSGGGAYAEQTQLEVLLQS